MATNANQSLFESYLAPCLKAAYGTAFYLTRNRDNAEDLVQEASLRAFAAFHTFQPGTNFKAWFLRILTNAFLSQRRQRQRQPEMVRWEGAAEAYLSDLVEDDSLRSRNPEPPAQLLKALTEQEIAQAFSQLPEEFRVVCALYFMEELNYQEIADIVGCPLGTVRSRLHRGRKVLQSRLKSLASERGFASAAR